MIQLAVSDAVLALMFRRGMSTRELADRFGVDAELIRRRLKKAGVVFGAGRRQS